MRLLIVTAAVAGVPAATPQPAPPTLALTGARIYTSPVDPPIEAGVVIVRGGRIVEVGPRRALPSEATVIDCAGQIMTAGFWNSHVHLIARQFERAATAPAEQLTRALERMLVRHGFTSVVDTGSPSSSTMALRRRIDDGDVAGPRILTTGEILFPKRGSPPGQVFKGLDVVPGALLEIGTPEDAVGRIRDRLDAGADAIKLYIATWWNDPPVRMPAAIVRAATEEAHRRDRQVLAHPSDIQGIETALDGGVDVIVHTTPAPGPWPEALVARMRQQRIAVIPTLKLWRAELVRQGLLEVQGRAFQRVAQQQLGAFARAGGEVLFGTDVGYMQDTDTSEEFKLMAGAGMDFRQILASLTTAPAARFGGPGRTGRIVPGEPADLVLLAADPAGDASAFANVARVIRGGRVIYVKRG